MILWALLLAWFGLEDLEWTWLFAAAVLLYCDCQAWMCFGRIRLCGRRRREVAVQTDWRRPSVSLGQTSPPRNSGLVDSASLAETEPLAEAGGMAEAISFEGFLAYSASP